MLTPLTLLVRNKNSSITGVVGSFQTPNASITSLQKLMANVHSPNGLKEWNRNSNSFATLDFQSHSEIMLKMICSEHI